jgi:hypothetical protein
VKEKSKGQTRPKPGQARRQEMERKRRLAEQQAEEQLWREMQPFSAQFDLETNDHDEQIAFASHIMIESAALYDEPEFHDLDFPFTPAEAMYAMVSTFNVRVPPPDELERLPEEERNDALSEARVYAIAEFIEPRFQKDLLKAFARCRQRLAREKRPDPLAKAAAAEWVLRGDTRPEIWATCGILHRAFRNTLEQAFAFQRAADEALAAAQAIQPSVTEVEELEPGSPADKAFRKAASKTPGLLEYLDRQAELELERIETLRENEGELAIELFDPEEVDQLFEAMVACIQAPGADLAQPGHRAVGRDESLALTQQLSEALKAVFPPERFQEMMDDLQGIIEDGDPSDPVVQTALMLHDPLSDKSQPYWENPAFIQFCLGAVLESALGAQDELTDEEFDELYDLEFDEEDPDDA